MKRILIYFILIAPFALLVSCTDVDGDGIGTIIYEGSTLPETSSFRNPVWEPDLSHPSAFRGATQFFAFGDQKEWSTGLNYTVPVLRSSNLMSWSYTGEAFLSKPDWAEAPVTSVSGLFAKTLGLYFISYTLGDEGIGIAWAKAPQGPYTDYGRLFPVDSLGFDYCHHPFLIQSGLSFFLFYETEDGVFGTQLNLSKSNPPSLSGDPFQILGTGYTGIHINRASSTSFTIFATVGYEDASTVVMAQASSIQGPYLDKSGNDLSENGNGTPVIEGDVTNGYVAPGHVGGVFADYEGTLWILYQAMNIDKPLLSSGSERRPVMLHKLNLDGEGWPAEVVTSTPGWMTPKYKLSE